jgi:hypothetical protein
MGYGLGKSGWVSVKRPNGAVPLDMFEEWIDESYDAVAKPHGKEPAKAEPNANVAPKRRTTVSAPVRDRAGTRSRGTRA